MGHIINGVIAIDEGLGKCVMESGGGGGGVSLDVPVLKYKKRKVSAVRDFPPGCGRKALAVNGESNENRAAAGDTVKTLSSETGDVHNLVGSTSGVDGGLDQWDSPYLSKALLDEMTKEADDSAGLETQESVDTVDELAADTSSLQTPVESVLPEKPIEEVSDHSKSPVPVDAVLVTAQKKNFPRRKVPALRDFPPVDAVLVTAQKKNFPRRNVSALRDFPPGCGRNAAPVNLKAHRKSVDSSKSNGLGRENSCEDDSPEQNVKVDTEPGDGKVLAGDSMKSKIKENKFDDRLQLKSGDMVKKQRTEQVHHKEISMKHPRDNNISRSESPVTKMVDRVGGSSGGNSGMQSTKFSKGLSFKRKVPVKPMDETPRASQSQEKTRVGSFEDREVVLSVMAKPKCPWALGKKPLTPASSDRLQVDQGKKTLKSVTGNESQSELGKKIFKTPDGSGSQSVQGKKLFESSTASHSGASQSHGSRLSEDREIVLSLAAPGNRVLNQGKKPVKSSGGQAKLR